MSADLHEQRSEPLDVAGQHGPEHEATLLLRDRGVAIGPFRELDIGGAERLRPVGFDQHSPDRRECLVAGRPLHGPVRQRLLSGQDLLDEQEHVGPDRIAKTAEIRGRIAEPVDVVDPEAIDDPIACPADHERVRRREDILPLAPQRDK